MSDVSTVTDVPIDYPQRIPGDRELGQVGVKRPQGPSNCTFAESKRVHLHRSALIGRRSRIRVKVG